MWQKIRTPTQWSLPILWRTKMYENLSKSSFFCHYKYFQLIMFLHLDEAFGFWGWPILQRRKKLLINKTLVRSTSSVCHFTKPSQIAPKNQCGDVNAWHGFLFNAPQFVVVLEISQSLKNEASHLVSNEANHIEYVRS